MQILRRDRFHQIAEPPFLARWTDDYSIAVERDINFAVFLKVGLDGKRLRNPDRETISPPLDGRNHRAPLYLHYRYELVGRAATSKNGGRTRKLRQEAERRWLMTLFRLIAISPLYSRAWYDFGG